MHRDSGRRRYAVIKRAMDVGVAGAGLVALSPLLLTIAALVRVKLGSPVLFRQYRPGLRGRPFRLVKFRSMRDGVGDDAARLTPFGRRLRASSLDELPELWNVLRGDMSLVGPRPLLPEYLEHYDERQGTRHDVRPGITGLAQVTGRNRMDWPAKLEADATYVERFDLRLDLRILWLTAVQAVRGQDTTADGYAAGMERFDDWCRRSSAGTTDQPSLPFQR